MYDLGDPYPLTIRTLDEDRNPADVDSVTVVFTLPNQTMAGPFALARRSLGVYEYDYVTTAVGLHSWRVTVVGGDASGAQFDVFHVDGPASVFPLVGLEVAKAHLNIPSDRYDDDEELRRMVASASGLVEQATRLWHRATVVERLPAAGRALFLSSLPVVAITSVVQGATTLAASGYRVDPFGALVAASGTRVVPWQSSGLYDDVVVTYEAGETVVPGAVREAVLDTVEAIWMSQRGPVRSPLRGGSGYEDEDAVPDPDDPLPYGARKKLERWAKGPVVA